MHVPKVASFCLFYGKFCTNFAKKSAFQEKTRTTRKAQNFTTSLGRPRLGDIFDQNGRFGHQVQNASAKRLRKRLHNFISSGHAGLTETELQKSIENIVDNQTKISQMNS